MREEKENYLHFKQIGVFTPAVQIGILLLMFVSIAVLGKFCLMNTGMLFGKPVSFYIETLFAPVYEEIIFRGIIFALLLKHYSLVKSIILSSLLFGIWHIKNIFFMDVDELIKQIVYAGFIFGPLLCYITYKTKTIWIASVVHYLNNFLMFLLIYSKH